MPKNNNNLDKKEVSAKEVKKTAGISYRQIHTWDSKKVLPKSSGGKSAWRKFTGKDVIKLTILSKLVSLGVPINKLRKLASWLNKTTAIDYLIQQMSYGLNMFLCTDLEGNFAFYSEGETYEIVISISDRMDSPTIVLPVNKLVGNVLDKLGIEKPKISNELRFPNITKSMNKEKDLAETEEKIISLIREKKYQTIVVQVQDGKVIHVKREESFKMK